MSSHHLLDPTTDRDVVRGSRSDRLLEPVCRSCDGEEAITVMSADGAWVDIPCPGCAPNDAPGG